MGTHEADADLAPQDLDNVPPPVEQLIVTQMERDVLSVIFLRLEEPQEALGLLVQDSMPTRRRSIACSVKYQVAVIFARNRACTTAAGLNPSLRVFGTGIQLFLCRRRRIFALCAEETRPEYIVIHEPCGCWVEVSCGVAIVFCAQLCDRHRLCGIDLASFDVSSVDEGVSVNYIIKNPVLPVEPCRAPFVLV